MLKDLISGKSPFLAKRSPQWRKVRANFLVVNPTCAACGGKEKLEVHHKIPFHVAPELELDPANLITLCESKKMGINCHLFVGHAGNYRTYRDDSHVWAKIVYHSFFCVTVRYQPENID